MFKIPRIVTKALFFIIAYALMSCSSHIKITQNTKSSLTDDEKVFSYPYCLPKNDLEVRLEWKERQYVKGPYADFSESLIHLKPLYSLDNKVYSLNSIDIRTEVLKDTQRCYLIQDNDKEIVSQNLNQILKSHFSNVNQSYFIEQELSEEPFVFKELGLSKTIIQEDKKGYKTIEEDSVTKRIPVTNKIVRRKTLEEMAKDAAKTLLKIRKRKFRIIAALNTTMPDGMALKEMLKALNEKEQYYESLFLGHFSEKIFSKTIKLQANKLGNYLLCYFDVEKGVAPDKTFGNPIWLKISKEKTGVSLFKEIAFEKNEVTLEENKVLGFPYILPEYCEIEVIQNKISIYKKQDILPQFNQVHYLPIQFLKDNVLTINTSKGTIEAIK